MTGVVVVTGDEATVRTARAVLGGRGWRVVPEGEPPAGARRIIHVRRIRTTAFDGFEVVAVRPGAERKVWAALASPGTPGRRSEGVLALVLLEFLEGLIDPSPTVEAPPPRRRRRPRARRDARPG